MKNDGNDFLELLKKAIKKVAVSYQSIHTADLCSEKYFEFARERVYCYELYHQLRLIIDEKLYDINGEIDKRGHKLITEGFNPDILIHKQGNMDNNELVLEVKINWDNDGVEKDFNNLNKMTTEYKYKFGAFLFVGGSLSEITQKILKLKNPINFNNSNIHVICVNGEEIESSTLNSILFSQTPVI